MDYPKMIYPDGPTDENGKPNVGIMVTSAEEEKARMSDKLKTGGPTIEQWVADGYKASDYPPKGYAANSSANKIKAAVEAEKGA